LKKSSLYSRETPEYFTNVRYEIIDLIPDGENNILDVGCGKGTTLCTLKKLCKAKKTVGIELNDFSIESDIKNSIDEIICGDIETFTPNLEKKNFDFIIFADILEHLINPHDVLNKYTDYLKDDGFIIASTPNIKFYRILFNLVFLDKFEYSDSGILDETHLRFFTRHEIKKMFEKSNLEIIYISHNFGFPFTIITSKFLLNILRFIPLNSFITQQYIIKAWKKVKNPEVLKEIYPTQQSKGPHFPECQQSDLI
jgi:2-polyprenyl-3-methyl-5-hydroxy-6-metoxy-1,4-benzoquinol methylase